MQLIDPSFIPHLKLQNTTKFESACKLKSVCVEMIDNENSTQNNISKREKDGGSSIKKR
jgi:hypothetical protein